MFKPSQTATIQLRCVVVELRGYVVRRMVIYCNVFWVMLTVDQLIRCEDVLCVIRMRMTPEV